MYIYIYPTADFCHYTSHEIECIDNNLTDINTKSIFDIQHKK